jgi:hypothetical protein
MLRFDRDGVFFRKDSNTSEIEISDSIRQIDMDYHQWMKNDEYGGNVWKMKFGKREMKFLVPHEKVEAFKKWLNDFNSTS